MKKSWLIGGAAVAALYFLYQQGVSTTPGVGDPSDTDPDGGAAGGTDAGIMSDVIAYIGAPDYVNAWADAITIHEGWTVGSRSYRNNNPGNLEIQGDLGVDSGGYGIFSSYSAGRNALVSDLVAKVNKYGSWTLYQVMARYAPPSENNTQAYADAVASALSVTTTTLVNAISGIWSSQGLVWTPVTFPSMGAQPAQQPQADASSSTDSLVSDSTALTNFDPTDPSSVSDALTQVITGIDPNAIDLSGLDDSGGS
jgi:hypothetical protein